MYQLRLTSIDASAFLSTELLGTGPILIRPNSHCVPSAFHGANGSKRESLESKENTLECGQRHWSQVIEKMATPAERAGASDFNHLQGLAALTALNAAKELSSEVTNLPLVAAALERDRAARAARPNPFGLEALTPIKNENAPAPSQIRKRAEAKRPFRDEQHTPPLRTSKSPEGGLIECEIRKRVGLVTVPREHRRQIRDAFPPPMQMSDQRAGALVALCVLPLGDSPP
jgi:hypothetical protein